MQRNAKLFLLVIISFILSGALHSEEAPEYIKYADEICRDFVEDMKNQHGLVCYGSGGGMAKEVASIQLYFYAYEKLSISRARELGMLAMNNLLDRINSHEKIRPFLAEYPFTPSRTSISISANVGNGAWPHDGSICGVSCINGRFYYDKAAFEKYHISPTGRTTKQGDITQSAEIEAIRDQLVHVYDESYEEAVQKVKQASINPNSVVEEYSPQDYEPYIDEISQSFQKAVCSKYPLLTRGTYVTKGEKIEQFDSIFKTLKRMPIEKQRKMQLKIAKILLDKINSHKKIRPFLAEFPFPLSRIHLITEFCTESYYHWESDGRVVLVELKDGNIAYKKSEYLDEMLHFHGKDYPLKKEKLIPVLEESYDEAKEKVQKSSILYRISSWFEKLQV